MLLPSSLSGFRTFPLQAHILNLRGFLKKVKGLAPLNIELNWRYVISCILKSVVYFHVREGRFNLVVTYLRTKKYLA